MTPPASPHGGSAIDERWRRLLNAVIAVQSLLPETTLIGGSAVTSYTGHRLSADADLVLRDLDRNWQVVRDDLEQLDNWITDYPKIPTNLMGRYDGVRVSIRKLNRIRDIEIETFEVGGQSVRVAAPDELVRMKALALLSRNLTRDYVDLAALDSGLTAAGRSAAAAIQSFDDYYTEHRSGGSLAREITTILADPRPRESDPQSALNELVALRPDLRDWTSVKAMCQRIVASVE